ncbi:NTP transferase domain-containing protein [Methanobacterium formicicum]|jgi:adenosylcobinamide-phosphate guanylyltransferase|uniref:Acylneuraminate cytidylyltransferase n=1 Tax=Methanobacterium formicicum TaxID=2162 RepID=A0A089ZCG2_METFO|nr:NTP transferase domain-containing protein [Methanobacterium formicicum]AIS31737.1 GTP:adenosylcobinamide-phosphate guanylyltransferase CobY [Methanobacterium formicicum]CEL25601.1 acylneuraminate cytidylyltransferase [Methanobacterium formicicum]
MVVAVIMAGGKGTRMNSQQEKPLIIIEERPLIEYVLQAVDDSSLVDEIIVAVSPHTSQTGVYAENLGLKVLKTPGNGYVEDLSFILAQEELTDEVILTVTADLPLLTGQIIDRILEEYHKSPQPAMSVMVPVEIFREHGLQASLVLENRVPSGLNILRGKNTEQDEEVLVLDKIELALNINSPEDIICLKKLWGNSRR